MIDCTILLYLHSLKADLQNFSAYLSFFPVIYDLC